MANGLNLSFNLSDKSRKGELKTVKSLSLLIEILALVWFVFMVIGAACYNNGWWQSPTWKAGVAFLSLFGIVWAAILVLAIIVIMSAADLQSRYNDKNGTVMLIFGVCTIFIPVIFAILTYSYANQSSKIETTTTAK